jgi:hypothetical protein
VVTAVCCCRDPEEGLRLAVPLHARCFCLLRFCGFAVTEVLPEQAAIQAVSNLRATRLRPGATAAAPPGTGRSSVLDTDYRRAQRAPLNFRQPFTDDPANDAARAAGPAVDELDRETISGHLAGLSRVCRY